MKNKTNWETILEKSVARGKQERSREKEARKKQTRLEGQQLELILQTLANKLSCVPHQNEIGSSRKENVASLAQSLENAHLIFQRDGIGPLEMLARKFDRSEFKGTEYHDECDAVYSLIQILLDFEKAETTYVDVAKKLYNSPEMAEDLMLCNSLCYLVLVADLWPLYCQECGVINPPPFDRDRCYKCRRDSAKSTTVEQLPTFSVDSGDWILSVMLAEKLGERGTTYTAYRKDSKETGEDEHGEWGIDQIGFFRRKVVRQQVGYYIPKFSDTYKMKWVQAKNP